MGNTNLIIGDFFFCDIEYQKYDENGIPHGWKTQKEIKEEIRSKYLKFKQNNL